MSVEDIYLETIDKLKRAGVEYVVAEDPKSVKRAVEWGSEENLLTLEVVGSEGFACYKVTFH